MVTTSPLSLLEGATFSTSSADLVVAWFVSITGREPTRADIAYRDGVFTAVVTQPSASSSSGPHPRPPSRLTAVLRQRVQNRSPRRRASRSGRRLRW
ncbi:MAG: hypothetical protein OEV40_24885 [Acidimicrobiia bacterium]|nr:hypothetical protein [Acidimicrobiia bacterium]